MTEIDPLHPGILEIQIARRGLNALFLEVAEPVAIGVGRCVSDAFKALAGREARVREAMQHMTDAAEMLWVVLANVSGGDWTQQSAMWQQAAARYRDQYFAVLAGFPSALTAPFAELPLPASAQQVLNENLWTLYDDENTPPSQQHGRPADPPRQDPGPS